MHTTIPTFRDLELVVFLVPETARLVVDYSDWELRVWTV